MKYIVSAALFSLLAMWLYLRSPQPTLLAAPPTPTKESTSASVAPAVALPNIQNPGEYRAGPDSAIAEVSELARRSLAFAELPEPDQLWVKERAANSYTQGQVPYGDLVRHIEELSSVRMFAVLERTETYTPTPDETLDPTGVNP